MKKISTRLLSAFLWAVCCFAEMPAASVIEIAWSQNNNLSITGVVLDPSGAVVSGAEVVIRQGSDRTSHSTTSDRNGQFRFTRVKFGQYEVEVKKDGFSPVVTKITVGTVANPPLEITLPIAELREELAVDDNRPKVNTNPEDNLNVIRLDREDLKKLPALGGDVIGSLVDLLDGGSVGSTGPTVIIDGLESSKRRVPASMIQEVRINQDPYSAEYSRMGRGRIEVITKAGSSEYHGELNFIFRDHHLDARNAFASMRPPEQRRIFEGNLSGPIANRKKSSFILGINREEEDLQSIVYALTPTGLVTQNLARPNRDTELSLRLNHQAGDKTTFSIRYEHTFDSESNSGAGGFNLPETSTNSAGREHEFYFTLRRILSPNLINEFTLRVGTEINTARGISDAQGVVVLDAFTGGGSQADRRSTVSLVQLNQIVSWDHGKHFIKGGLNIPYISRRGLRDKSNFGGTFTFSSLADYLNNRPFLFSINQGDGGLDYWHKEYGIFILDNIRVRPNFSIGLGLRYDRQNYLNDSNNLGPRVSIAYSPDKKRKTVIRAGGGVFYDRTGSGPIADILRFDGKRLRRIEISNPGFPDPFASGGMLSSEPPSIVRFEPELRTPYTIQSSLHIERQLTGTAAITAGYINTRGIKLFRSRNINAPFRPETPLPDPTIGVLRQIESSANTQSHVLDVVLRGKLSRFFNGTIQYTLARAWNNSGGINSLPADNYDLTLEWSRAEFDERHRLYMLGIIKAGDWFDIGVTLLLNSGRPYSLTTGRDDNRDTVANDRPAGVRRNSMQGPGSATINLRWSREFELKKKGKDEGATVKVGVDAFNALNRVNFAGFVGNLSSPFFGLPVAARPARRLQLSFGFEF